MPPSRPWWLWPNLLSLDAPLVAVVWQWFLATSAGFQAPAGAAIALAGVVWGIYLVDRRLDAFHMVRPATDRHRFARANPLAIVSLAVLALPVGIVAGMALPTGYLMIGGAVAAASAGYFAVVHLGQAKYSLPGAKELCVGVVFSGGVTVPLFANVEAVEWQLAAWIALAGLCSLNCLLISRWEGASEVAPSSLLAAGAAAAAAGAASFTTAPVAAAVYLCLLLFGVLDMFNGRMSGRGLRVLADTAMLTPLAVMAAVWLHTRVVT